MARARHCWTALESVQGPSHIPAVPKRIAFITPAAPVLKREPPVGPQWIHEVKFDGWRMQLHKAGDRVVVFGRNSDEYELIRIVVAYRRIARKVKYIAHVQRISEAAVKRILLEHGDVPRRGRGYWWSGPYTISEAKHRWLAFPDYIPLHIDGVSFQITNGPAWMGITRDDITFGVPTDHCARGATGKVSLFTKQTARSMKRLLPQAKHATDCVTSTCR